MVESRNICAFEKNVLISLIGATLQPGKFGVLDAYFEKTIVSDLIRQLCSGFEEEIGHLKYFYKTATLVREGMIVMQSSDIAGNVADATVGHSP